MDVPLAKPLPLAIIKYILLDHDIICIYFLFLSSLTIKIGLNPKPWHCLCRVDLRPLKLQLKTKHHITIQQDNLIFH